MRSLDLNCDMGELLLGQSKNFDVDILPFVSSCNIACGFHSGTPMVIDNTIRAAIAEGVSIGAHPSYNDPAHFGRRSITVPIQQLLAEWRYQIAALKGMVESLGGQLQHVKPHGALYNDMAKDVELAHAFVGLVKTIDPQLNIMGLAHTELIACCQEQGMTPIREGFADRSYDSLTQLRSRNQADAVLHEPADVLAQIAGFLREELTLSNGRVVPVQVDSLCLHSDTQGAVTLSQTIHEYLTANGVDITAL